MAAERLDYYDYDRTAVIVCPDCAWQGPSVGHEDFHDALLDVECPSCQRMLLIVPYPTTAETRRAAAAGNPRAIADLDGAIRVDDHQRR